MQQAAPPARERVRERLPADVRELVPDVALDARIGKGTVASEFDRTVSVRLEGGGTPSQRRVVPQTTTAEQLLASPAGPAFERMVRRTMAVGDAAQGRENLSSITLVPDEHALKAYEMLDTVSRFARRTGAVPRFSDEGTAATERAAAQQYARDVARNSPRELGNTLAWNAAGDIAVMPDVSRRLLATIDGYRLQDGDKLLGADASRRDQVLRDDWDTLLHEAHHSVTPVRRNSSQLSDMWEEAIPSVLALRERSTAARQAGADIPRIAADPAAGRDDGGLGWSGWNRDHLPQPSRQKREQTQATYVNGPEVLRGLLRMAGIDRRTTAGRDASFELLQGVAADRVPRRLADVLAERHGVDSGAREQLVRRVRESLAHPRGVQHVADLLEAGSPRV
jgi:hypothetical protein